jgi:hypothetical protein
MAEQFEPRRAQPGQVFNYTDLDGKQVTLRADDEGVIQPKNSHAAATLEMAGLPVARKVVAEQKTAEPKEQAKDKE